MGYTLGLLTGVTCPRRTRFVASPVTRLQLNAGACYRVHTSPLAGLETGLLGPHRLTSGRHDVLLLCRYCITLIRCCQAPACQLVASSYLERPVATLRLTGIRYRVAYTSTACCILSSACRLTLCASQWFPA